VLLAVSLFTGFMEENGPKSLQHNMTAGHVQSIYYVVIFSMLHIGEVLIADAGLDRGLISKMISGDKA
jgi:hypothetical protein